MVIKSCNYCNYNNKNHYKWENNGICNPEKFKENYSTKGYCDDFYPVDYYLEKILDLEAYQRTGTINYVKNRHFSDFTQSGFID